MGLTHVRAAGFSPAEEIRELKNLAGLNRAQVRRNIALLDKKRTIRSKSWQDRIAADIKKKSEAIHAIEARIKELQKRSQSDQQPELNPAPTSS